MTLSNSDSTKHGLFRTALLVFILLRLFLSSGAFFQLPPPSDHLQYLTPMVFGTTDYNVPSFRSIPMARSGWPWLDRISFATGIRLTTFLPIDSIWVAPVYANLLSLLVLAASLCWLYRVTNIVGVLFFGALYNTAYLVNETGGEMLPEGTLVFHALLAFICMFPNPRKQAPPLLFRSGFFSALATFSKAPGIVVPLALGLYALFRERRLKPVAIFSLGLIGGIATICGLFSVTFGIDELQATTIGFFSGALEQTYAGRRDYNNFVSYIQPMFSLQMLPIFSFLFLGSTALKYRESKAAILMAWSFVLMIYFCYYVSTRGYVPKLRYMYPAAVFSLLGISAYAGRIFEECSPNVARQNARNLFTIIATFLLLALGFTLSSTQNPLRVFEPRDVGDFSRLLGAFYGVGAIAVIVLPHLVSNWPRRPTIIIGWLFFVTAWTAAVPASVAIHDIKSTSKRTAWYYDNGPFFETVEKQLGISEATVYAADWSKVRFAYRLPWVYHLFFEDRDERPYMEGATHVRNNFHVYTSMKRFKAGRRLDYVLTDRPSEIQALFPETEVVQDFNWGESVFTVMKRLETSE